MHDPTFFPIVVWLQDPRRERGGRTNGENYKQIGVNVLVGVWEELSTSHLDAIPDGMYVMPDPGGTVTRSSPKVIGYVVADEPDMNLHPSSGGCILPADLARLIAQARAYDPTRPALVKFGKGVALPDFFHGVNCPYPDGRDAWRARGGFDVGDDPIDDWIDEYDYAPYYEWMKSVDIPGVDHYATTDQYEPAFNRHAWDTAAWFAG